ncbi:transcriptional regulator [Micromonospora sonchi]|uniref:Transcriptional regulator n=1 Tax=Micromonospora sonchi TaxID=1763543 RepID=A0A917U1H2_9ACTN|nr:helix-turn-helix domain-containing protein [Micromonospora sonchi]GGM48191.1 transcriptional regulator [Micromonospora sonchi]
MPDLIVMLQRRIDVNAQRAVDAYQRDVPEYAMPSPGQLAHMLDFARFIRRVSLNRARDDTPLKEDDLAAIGDVGRRRGEDRLSLASQRQALSTHTALMLGDVVEAAGPANTEDVLHMATWLGREGSRARSAYLGGYLAGVAQTWSVSAQVQMLAQSLLADEPPPTGIARAVGVRLGHQCLVTVVRCDPPDLTAPERRRIAEAALSSWRIPMSWLGPTELALLPPTSVDVTASALFIDGGVHGPVGDRTLDLVRGIAVDSGRRCAAGAVVGPVGHLAAALDQARQISRLTPPEPKPERLHTVADRFVELGVAHSPQMDSWLRDFITLLEAGPDLVRTLDTYYRHDMSRPATAHALTIHPRTLDYRLRRVHELTGLRPASTRGVRILTAAVARVFAERGWEA